MLPFIDRLNCCCIIILNSSQADCNFLYHANTIMDNIKIQNTQFQNRNKCSLHQFLDEKRQIQSRKQSIDSAVTEIIDEKVANLLPKFAVRIQGYSIGQHVEYQVILIESYRILKRDIRKQYKFKTRYSLLETLDRKIGGKGIPGKKLFGNKNPEFLEKRKVQLEEYLNRVLKLKIPEILKFVKQIKDYEFNKSLNEVFALE